MAEKTEVKRSMPETQFTQVQFTLQGLMNQVQMGQIGLPDIQRPSANKED